MDAIIAVSIIGFIVWAFTRSPDSKNKRLPLKPHVLIDGEYIEVTRRHSKGSKLICTLKGGNRGARRTKVAVPFDSVKWLPRR
jgi:hypothetical protein